MWLTTCKKETEREKVRHADQGLYTRNEGAIVSQRGPEYAREWQLEPVRARAGVTESHREPERDRERANERQGERQSEPEGARGSQSGSHSYPFGRLVTKKRLASHF